MHGLGLALRGFFHPSAGHPLLWNVKHALELRPLLRHIPDPARRAVVDEVLDRFEQHVQPVFGDLRAQVIHNDLTPTTACSIRNSASRASSISGTWRTRR